MLLNETQIAQKLGPAFTDLTETVKKRRVRKLINKAGITPLVFRNGTATTWCIPDNYLGLLTTCPLNSKKEPSRTAPDQRRGGSGALSKAERFLEAQRLLTGG